MALQLYMGGGKACTATNRISVHPTGHICVGALVYRQVPVSAKYVRVGYDDETDELVIVPCEGQDAGRSRFAHGVVKQGCRIACKMALKDKGLLPDEMYHMEGYVRDGCIRAPLPKGYPRTDKATPAQQPKPKRRPDRTRSICVNCVSWKHEEGMATSEGRCTCLTSDKYNTVTKGHETCEEFVSYLNK